MITILAVGKLKSPYRELAEDFLKRMPRFVRVIEIKEGDKVRETKEIIEKLEDFDGEKILCDSRGRLVEFGYFERIGEAVFVIGGPEGFTDEIKEHIDDVISFSRLTFNHQLFRIMLLEQMYRLYCLRKGMRYPHY